MQFQKNAEGTDTSEQSEHIPPDMARMQLCELRRRIKQRAFGKVTAHRIF